MYRTFKTAVCAAVAAGFVAGAAAAPIPQETFNLPDDDLAVTVASASLAQADPLESDLTIWVGEVEIEGRRTIWVELIDTYGEVIYSSEVNNNETHLLPDGRAVVVHAIDPALTVAKTDESRLLTEGETVVTRRVVEESTAGTSVEFIEVTEHSLGPDTEKSGLLRLAEFGDAVWASLLGLVHAAAVSAQVAWNWIVDTLHA
ncbi:hypothetical protein GCM10011316_15870 [Roseibium aquae]|uniref:Uncharacterized protein n=2 Tax=Roseibium aquae TaxID=1323746 RepID=A0A916TH58_9HYPH|nr:hypothetical protein GCM10011316_15870 [Roseibium aquae]